MKVAGAYKNMQIVKSSLVLKTNETISSVARSTSWSHGWLRGVIQFIFGLITVASFIIILLMAINSNKPSTIISRCLTRGCRVVCNGAPYYDEFEDDIIFAVTETGSTCDSVLLTLEDAAFVNHTLPEQWMSRLPSNIFELEIIGGNLQHIAPQAFMSRFTRYIQRLSLEYVTVMEWSREMLFGLVDLQEIVIKHTNLVSIKGNALEPVDNTLMSLSVTGSGYWDPTNLTGSSNLERLTNVIFSSNNFNSILTRRSLKKLKNCKVLHLNSCRIHSIGAGTFDSLVNIQMLHLSNNFLITLPTGLFDNISPNIHPRPRINLQRNKWLCECSNKDFQRLVTEELLLIDPTCHYPVDVRGVSFSRFLHNCHNNETRSISASKYPARGTDTFYMDGPCDKKRNSISSFISPIDFLTCPWHFKRLHLAVPNHDLPNKNEILQTTRAMIGDDYSVVEMSSIGSKNYGLIWYQENCVDEVYCISMMPKTIRIYNFELNAEYTFCPLNLSSGAVVQNKCVFHGWTTERERFRKSLRILMYTITVIICLMCGAMIVYSLIRKFPHLLKGSNRILFVKHRNVDALVLPPKVPPRTSLINSESIAKLSIEPNHIFLLPSNSNMVYQGSFVRSKSVRSSKSVAPSYISALQPTEEQLTEWRLRHHFDNNMVINDDDGLFNSLSHASIKTYESTKELY